MPPPSVPVPVPVLRHGSDVHPQPVPAPEHPPPSKPLHRTTFSSFGVLGLLWCERRHGLEALVKALGEHAPFVDVNVVGLARVCVLSDAEPILQAFRQTNSAPPGREPTGEVQVLEFAGLAGIMTGLRGPRFHARKTAARTLPKVDGNLVDVANVMMERLKDDIRAGRSTDMATEFKRFTLAAVMETMFGQWSWEAVDTLNHAIVKVGHALFFEITGRGRFYSWWHRQEIDDMRNTLLGLFAKLVVGRIQALGETWPPAAMLYMDNYVQAWREAGKLPAWSADTPPHELEGKVEKLMREPIAFMEQEEPTYDMGSCFTEVMIMFFGARDTTGALATWVGYVLASRGDVFERFRQEVDERYPSSMEGSLPLKDMGNLDYMRRIIQEAERLWPIMYLIHRQVGPRGALLTYRGHEEFMAPGTVLCLNTYAMTRLGWDRPTEFDPDRPEYDRDRAVELGKRLFPFGAPPHLCPGKVLAEREIALFFATMVRAGIEFASVEEAPQYNFYTNLGADASGLVVRLRMRA